MEDISDKTQSLLNSEVCRPLKYPSNYKYLDGLRGIACLSVMLFHLDTVNRLHWESWYYFTPLILLKKGVQCVYLFFTISGFVLPLGYFKKPDKSKLASAMYRRYLRLMLPMLVMYSLTFLLHCMFKNFKECSVTQNFGLMLYSSFFGVWKGEESSIFPWNPYVWTLYIEFWASFLIYGIAFLSFEYENTSILYLSIIIFCWAGNMCEYITDIHYDKNVQMIPFFVLGMMMADDEIRGQSL
jgi:peptidoglycan/LPS O-acetylase OafA/YrhL